MSPELSWFKSSYSDDQGGDCVEVAHSWHKFTRSRGFGTTHVRDSKLGTRSPQLAVAAQAWAAFVAYARSA
ncbi:DUF397 domain-containing protein [Streptomyces sp. NPDC060188]|uniref:DUF397 domain-containing protein n=1 Tax=Streptomyces sp. NPDC060188 TaxID=3347068 RepID=UPI003667130A